MGILFEIIDFECTPIIFKIDQRTKDHLKNSLTKAYQVELIAANKIEVPAGEQEWYRYVVLLIGAPL